METRQIDINLLEENTGQIEGLPANPRQWTETELDRLTKSIEETPELLEARGGIVIPYGDSYIVLGGNMRLQACRRLGKKEMPCYVLPEGTPAEKLKEIVIKDNGSFGSWDWDELANNWDGLSLVDWGVNVWEMADQAQGESSSSSSSSDSPEKGSTTSQRLLLQFGGNKIQMSEPELEGLQSIFDRHVERTGSSYGFVLNLIGGYFGDENDEEGDYADSEN